MTIEEKIVWLDIETSGYRVGYHQIIEFSAIVTNKIDLSEVDSTSFKLFFDVNIMTDEAAEKNKYDPKRWKDAIPQEESCNRMYAFLKKYSTLGKISKKGHPYSIAEIGGHNLRFDIGFLKKLFSDCDKFLPASAYAGGYFDTIHFAKLLELVYPGVRFGSVSLGPLAEALDIDPSSWTPHQSFDDIRITIEIAKIIKGLMSEE